MCEPEIIFADEPTGNLDAMTGADILDLLMGFGGKQFALVMVTHSEEAAARCDRSLHLEGGRLV
jgi:putative ABC transport system ATP-binding protein